MTGGTFILRLMQDDSVVMYMPLAPVSAIDLSLGLILGRGDISRII